MNGKKNAVRAGMILLLTAVLLLTGCAARRENGSADYTFVFRDEDGKGVQGVRFTLCDEDSCRMCETDREGKYRFTGNAYPYQIHVLSVPDGYRCDLTDAEAKPEGGSMTFTLGRAGK